jgi:hypothetical protein
MSSTAAATAAVVSLAHLSDVWRAIPSLQLYRVFQQPVAAAIHGGATHKWLLSAAAAKQLAEDVRVDGMLCGTM